MKQISNFIKSFKVVPNTSERAELVRHFVERVKNRRGESYKPAFIAFRLSHIETADLYYLKDKCDKARNFGAMFWHLIK